MNRVVTKILIKTVNNMKFFFSHNKSVHIKYAIDAIT